jgi:hypothetical protein
MASLYTKVKLYLEANGKSSNEIGSPSQNANVQILHEGDISSINVWNVNGLAKPNNSQLESYDSDGDAEETNNTIRNNRANSYPITKEFIEAYTEKEIGEDSTKWNAYVIKYNKVRTDNPKG